MKTDRTHTPLPKDGVNVTVGGKMAQLRKHIEAVEAHPFLTGKAIDFKLAESVASGSGVSEISSVNNGQKADVVKETGFDSLCVRLCKV